MKLSLLPPWLCVALLLGCGSEPAEMSAAETTSDPTTTTGTPPQTTGPDDEDPPSTSTSSPPSTSTSSTSVGGDTSSSSSDESSGETGSEDTATPIWIAATNYLQLQDELGDLGPFVVYGWATDPAFGGYAQQLDVLSQIDADDVTKIVMLSSWTTLESVLTPDGVAALEAAGVEGFGFNTEGMMTPPAQMQALNDPTESNPVAIFSTLAAEHGFWTVWGPIRVTADAVSDAAIEAMVAGGVRGVALQEQQFIEASCVDGRAAAVEATAERYRAVAGDPAFEVHVQVMPSRCANGDGYAVAMCGMDGGHPPFAHCEAFASAIAPSVDAMAIWASSPADVGQLGALAAVLRTALGH